MSTGEGLAIGLASAMFVVMLLGWLGIRPKRKSREESTERVNFKVQFNWFALMATIVIGVIIYLVLSDKEIPEFLSTIGIFLVIYYFFRS